MMRDFHYQPVLILHCHLIKAGRISSTFCCGFRYELVYMLALTAAFWTRTWIEVSGQARMRESTQMPSLDLFSHFTYLCPFTKLMWDAKGLSHVLTKSTAYGVVL